MPNYRILRIYIEKYSNKTLIYNSMFEVVFDNNIEVIIALINDCCGTNYNINKDNIKVEKREIPKLYRWAAIFNADNLEKIDYILGSNMLNMETKKEYLNKIEEASTDEIILSKVSLEEDFEGTIQDTIEYECAIAAKEARQYELEQGLKEGLEQGKEETILNNIKATLKKNISLKDISDISGKSIEKIKEVEKSIQ